MELVTVDDVDPSPDADGVDRRELAEPLDATGVAINHYRLPPGAGFPGGLHAHADQEEVFVVLEGTATFETFLPASAGENADDGAPSEGGEVTVRAGEVIRFAPDEFQSGRNASDEGLVAVAIGAPRDSEDVRIPLPCPACGHDELRLDTDGNGLALVCTDCGAEHVPGACPGCGSEDVRAALGDGDRPVARCHDCGAEFEEPPIRDRSRSDQFGRDGG